jgi:phospholipase C
VLWLRANLGSCAPSGDGGTAAGTITMGGSNIGAELTKAKLTWGWFEGGFDDGFVPGQGTPPTTAQICSENHMNVGGSTVNDYSPHHEPFEYYASTANSQVPVNSKGQPEQGRCGVGPRLPFLVISPWARSNWVDNTFIDQSSVVEFVEYNWKLPAMGNGAADAAAGSILSMFNFTPATPPNKALWLNPATGEPTSQAAAVAG